jgi:hypothetical protein
VELLVFPDLRKIRVITLGRGDEGVKEDFGGDPIFGELGAEAGLDGFGAVLIGD